QLFPHKNRCNYPSGAQHRKKSAQSIAILRGETGRGATRVKRLGATATAFLALMAGAFAQPEANAMRPDPTPVATEGPLAPASARHSVTIGKSTVHYVAAWSEMVL